VNINYGSAAKTIQGPITAKGNLTLNSAGACTFNSAGYQINVNGNLVLNASSTFVDAGSTIYVTGNITNSGTYHYHRHYNSAGWCCSTFSYRNHSIYNNLTFK